MVTVTHNKARLRDGKPMRAAGQRASFLKYLGDACKGSIKMGVVFVLYAVINVLLMMIETR